MKSLIEIFKIIEIFVHITSYLSDNDKIALLSCSKTFNANRQLLKFESTYDFSQIYDKWCFPCIKNVFINEATNHSDVDLGLESGIAEFTERSTTDPTLINPTHIELILGDNKINFHHTPYLLDLLRIVNYYILRKIISVIANKDEMLIESCKTGCSKVTKLLIEAGANVHAQNDKAIIVASRYGCSFMVKLLIKSGADVHAQCDAALRCAKEYNYPEIIRLLETCDHAQKNYSQKNYSYDPVYFALCGLDY